MMTTSEIDIDEDDLSAHEDEHEPVDEHEGRLECQDHEDDLQEQPQPPSPPSPSQLHFVHIKVDPDLDFGTDIETLPLAPAETGTNVPITTIPSLVPLRDITKCTYQDHRNCSNCFQRIPQIRHQGKKFSDPLLCSASSSRKGGIEPSKLSPTVLEALNMIFELEQKSWLSETILDPNYQICWKCTSALTQLYRQYVEFVGLTHKPSYINSIVQHNLALTQLSKVVIKMKKPKLRPKVEEFDDDDHELQELENDFDEPDLKIPVSDSFILPDKVNKHCSMRSSPRKSLRLRKPQKKYLEPEDDYLSHDGDDNDEFIPESAVQTEMNEELGNDDVEDYEITNRKGKPTKRKSASSNVKNEITEEDSDGEDLLLPKRKRTENLKKYKCSECHVGFSKPYKLKRHLNVHSQRKYTCEVCQAGFKHEYIVRKHMEIHDDNPKKSAHNVITPKPKSNLKLATTRHLSREERRRGLICKDCGIVFSSAAKLKRHANFQHYSTSTRYTCPESGCTIKFKSASTMDRHRVAAHGLSKSILEQHVQKTKPGEDYIFKPGGKNTRRYQCPQCPATFLRTDHIMRHSVVHQEKNFICTICNAGFKRQSALRMHARRIHEHPPTEMISDSEEYVKKPKPKLPKILTCEEPDCNSSFTTVSHYRRHLVSLHNKEHAKPEPIAPTPCPVCNTVYQTASKLQRHLLNHHRPMIRENKFECETCGKKYRDRNNLRNHQASHRLDRPFLCDLCGFSTKRSYQLTRHHEMVHIGLRPHLCTTCGMSFKKKQHLRDHETKHYESSHRPYVCSHEGCTKAYRSRRNLRQHLESHLGCKFICETCGRIFTRKDNLKVHVDTLHLGKPGRTAKDKEKVGTMDGITKSEDGEPGPSLKKSSSKPRKPRKSRAKAPKAVVISQNNEAEEEDEFEDETPPPPPPHFQPHHILQITQAHPARQIHLAANPSGTALPGANIIALPNQFGEFYYM